ncbi:MAG: hypothetical protein HY683_04205 [Chloroflexi bacterium]|nr:hypothetical protein [Chloroflexota bacterium]
MAEGPLVPLRVLRVAGQVTLVILATIATTLLGQALWAALVVGSLVLLLLLAAQLALHYNHRWKVLFGSGFAEYIFTYPTEENKRVWPRTKRSLRYLGVSAGSIGLDDFLRWANGLPADSPLRISFLLMDPKGATLAARAAHQKDRAPGDPSLAQAVEADRQKIRANVAVLKTSLPYQAGKMEIRLYDEFLPWWMYFLDDEEAVIGVLPKGHPGIDAPVMVLRRNRRYPSPYDAFDKLWDTLWEKAGPESARGQAGPAVREAASEKLGP